MMTAMSYDDDPWSGWQESQPSRTDTQLPRQDPPLVQASPLAMILLAVTGVLLALVAAAIFAKEALR